MELTIEQKRALAMAAARKRAAQKAPVEGFGSITPTDPSMLERAGNALYDAGKAIGLPVDRMRRDNAALDAGVRGAADVATFGTADEISAGLGSLTGIGGQQGNYEGNLNFQRAVDKSDAENHSTARGVGQLAGGLGVGMLMGPASFSARAAPGLGSRVGAGMADGGIAGALYGAGSGEGIAGRAFEAGKDGLIGLLTGGLFPVAAKGAGSAYSAVAEALAGRGAAKKAGTSPEVLRMLGTAFDADGTMGAVGQANMARAGQDAMLADAGPNAKAILDTAIQRGGPGGVSARNAISQRTDRATGAVGGALDSTLGGPQGVTATQTGIRQGSAAGRRSAYDAAYDSPIDYADPRGRAIESIIKTRVPQSAISAANELMRTEGHASRQILAKVADDGSVVFETLPDVRQLDYITRGLNEVADQADGMGKLGGTTAKGRAYSNLSGEIRDNLRDLVPEYAKALETAADPIRRSKAVELGSRLLSPSMTRDQVEEAVQGMTGAERAALAQGIRSRLDDMMANVTRTVQDGDTGAREAVKAIKDLSSRANREKLATAIGKQKADALFAEIDRAATSFDLRASVAENSKTYARLATDRRVKEITEPGFIAAAAQGKPLKSGQRIAQALTGQTPERVARQQDAIYSQLADVLTRPAGQGKMIFEALNRMGSQTAASRLMNERIARALAGPHLSYPTSVLLGDKADRLLSRQ